MTIKLRWGFKKEANEYAREFRQEMGLTLHGPLCPWQLAQHLEIPMFPLSTFSGVIEDSHINQLTQTEHKKSLSALTVFRGTRRLIVYNDSNSKARQASDICHELAHSILGHTPTETFNSYGDRFFNKEVEQEADWLGFALLISKEAALHIARSRITLEEAARRYRCTKHAVRFRLNMTAAYRRAV